MPSIVELADCIILDDVTDVFYRSLSFSNFERTIYDEKSEVEEQFDNIISERLLQKLDWTSGALSANPSLQFICELLKTIHQKDVEQSSLTNLLTKHARLFDNEANQSKRKLKIQLDQSLESFQKPSYVYPLIWQYFKSSVHGNNKHLFQQIFEFSEQIVITAQKKLSESEQTNVGGQLQKIALLNALPILILLMLLDNEIGQVNNELMVHEGDKIIEPCAETAFSFFIFDEFLKPQIFENIDQEQYFTWLDLQRGEVDYISRVFLEARTTVMLDALSGEFILTPQQKRKFSEQLGSQFKISSHISNVVEYRSFWRQLLNINA